MFLIEKKTSYKIIITQYKIIIKLFKLRLDNMVMEYLMPIMFHEKLDKKYTDFQNAI